MENCEVVKKIRISKKTEIVFNGLFIVVYGRKGANLAAKKLDG